MVTSMKKTDATEKVLSARERKILTLLNSVGDAAEILGMLKNVKGADLETGNELISRRSELAGFKSMKQIENVLSNGHGKYKDVVDALAGIDYADTDYTITGSLKMSQKTDLKLVAFACVNGVELARADVDQNGKYRLAFKYRAQPADMDVHILPDKLVDARNHAVAFRVPILAGKFTPKNKNVAGYSLDLGLKLVPSGYVKGWVLLTTHYHMHGTVFSIEYDSYGGILNVTQQPGMKMEFYTFSAPGNYGYLGYTYSDQSGNYQFDFDFMFRRILWPGIVIAPDIVAKIYQFRDGAWIQIFESTVAWNIVTDFERDYFIPKGNLLPAGGNGVKPSVGFRYISLGLIPIDSNHFHLGYVTTYPGDPLPGIRHQPLCGTLRIFGLFAENPPVASYKVQYCAADEDGPIGTAWTDITSPLYNNKWDYAQNKWKPTLLGPDPVTGRYTNIDTDPEADWTEHTLKLGWTTNNGLPGSVPDGYYALQIIGYDVNGIEVVTLQMPVIRIDNSMPQVAFAVETAVTNCGVLSLEDDGTNKYIRFKVTAYDSVGHMLCYVLSGTRGMIAQNAGTPKTEGRGVTDLLWNGVQNEVVPFIVGAPSGLNCPSLAYNFKLTVYGLPTNGYLVSPQWTQKEINLVVNQ